MRESKVLFYFTSRIKWLNNYLTYIFIYKLMIERNNNILFN